MSVCAISDSKHTVISAEGIDLAHWRKTLDRSAHRANPAELARHITDLQLTNTALVDCTASDDVAAAYPEFVKANMHIITPNKRANVLPWNQYETLMQLVRERRKYFLYEANVGAGLPIISTLNDLVASGDTIISIDGIFSGTLSYLFSAYDGTCPFSDLVRQAHHEGFTEPDPREDLSGQDVARKLLILARQLGRTMDLSDVAVDNLVPALLRKGRFSDRFYDRFTSSESRFRKTYAAAAARGNIIRYVGQLKDDRASAGIREFPKDHPFAAVKGTDNVVAFTTHRYSRTPLIIQGPGAGADVTAMGVFSDILKLLHYLPY